MEKSPCVKDLQKVLFGGKRFGNHVDEVSPGLFLGDMSAANDRYMVWKLGVTHVLNAAHGSRCSEGNRHYYGDGVHYYGVPADDSPTFDLSPYFFPCAQFIHHALCTAGGKAAVLVHCAAGVSRSAALLLSYFMICHACTLMDAILKVKERRWIFPNKGFLKQLCALQVKLRQP
ncbi:dual specificity protein phosphatase 13A-like isoform X1 [Entelurus aequoreus]|uniref:dual specificity protein phosphatase 13A-like isoform X1 n=1 Tax=Entelurus aequoreus TaxID=161455 RepID=UPI002B1E8A8A|nr:dual specificity protein phosphatase 13A-like isoform X1 [Entelurus aequoreus]